jgi:dolichol-phosphate mannosyltransferase
LNHFFTFADRNTGGAAGFFGRLGKFFLMCNIGGLIQIGVANLLTITFGMDDLVSILIAIAVATLWNFLMNNRLTWKN